MLLLTKPTKHLIGVALFTAASTVAVVAQCLNPPTNPGLGVRPGTVLRYQFIGTVSQQSCVEAAFTEWSEKNAQPGGNGVSFAPRQDGQTTNIPISMQNLGTSIAGGITAPGRDADGYITGYGMQFNTNTSVIESCEGFLKAAMHEAGHGQALADANGSGASSVMNGSPARTTAAETSQRMSRTVTGIPPSPNPLSPPPAVAIRTPAKEPTNGSNGAVSVSAVTGNS